jgi:hypothetical protein
MRNTSKLKSKKQLKSGGSLGGGGQLVPLKSLSARKRLRARSEKMQKKYQEDQERFWSKVDKTETCWLWTASTNVGGYGQFSLDNRPMTSHRFSYSSIVGEIPEGYFLDHLCRVRLCCNPTHLEPVTPQENTLRGAICFETIH